uniref:Uncharacterized protein n=1 Tax=Oryza glumipatula TaxID=40148 RepID=A0A0D9YM26_9ORYZ
MPNCTVTAAWRRDQAIPSGRICATTDTINSIQPTTNATVLQSNRLIVAKKLLVVSRYLQTAGCTRRAVRCAIIEKIGLLGHRVSVVGTL